MSPRTDNSWPLSERQVALVRSAEVDDDRPNCYAVTELACALPLDRPRLATAFEDTVGHHPVLRSAFDFRPGRVPGQILQGTAGELDVVDLRTTSAQSRARILAETRREWSARRFDPAVGPLIRLAACQLAEEEFRLITVVHPALLDRWSLKAFHVELLTRYRGSGLQIEPDSVSVTSANAPVVAVAAQAASTADPVAAWANSFADFTASRPKFWITEPDEAGAADGAGAADTVGETAATAPPPRWVPVSEGLTRNLTALADRLGVPFAHVLLAAHAKAVGAAAGRVDVVVGVETECWDRDAPRPLGMLTNVLATRIDLAACPWTDLVRRVAAVSSSAQSLRHQSYLRVQRILGAGQLLDSSFCYSESGIEADFLDGEGSVMCALAGHPAGRDDTSGHARLPVEGTVLVEAFRGASTGQLALRLTAGRDLAEAQLREVARLHVEILARCAAADESHQNYSPLTPHQERLLLSHWNRPVHPAGINGRTDRLLYCVHELFEQQVPRTPDAIAVTDVSHTLTYRELNAQANRIARRLRSVGIGAGSVVGVQVRRDVAMLTSFLAVLKAGAAYLPLDLQQPAERIAYMLSDAGATLVLSDGVHMDAVPAGKWSVLGTDELSESAMTGPDTDLGPISSPSDLMYVIYTSGSTGRPKGVQVPHCGVANYLSWCADAYARRRSQGGTVLFSSAAFNMVIPVLYVPLIMGQRVCLIDETLDMLDVAEQLIRLAPFTFIKLTPSQLRILIDLIGTENIRGLAGTLVVGAEAFSVSTLRQWRRADPETPVVNEYGPTEASVGNCVHFADGGEDDGLLPIGRPIPNTTIYVVDPTLALVPVGVPGELCIGGVGIARGYSGRPSLTAERFIADPFSLRPGARLYRTGDIGRWLPGGVLTFLGRADGQLKIRGYRIEPAEVEAALVEHPAISAAVVSGAGTFPDALSLVGYYVSARELSPAEVRAFLVRRLPEYMVPNFLVSISEIPLNANGKVDYKALPGPHRRQPDIREGTAAASEPGPALARIWTAVFAVDEVSPTDPIVANEVDLFQEAQLALQISQSMGINAGRAFRLVENATTMGELHDQLAQEAHTGIGDRIAGRSGPEPALRMPAVQGAAGHHRHPWRRRARLGGHDRGGRGILASPVSRVRRPASTARRRGPRWPGEPG